MSAERLRIWHIAETYPPDYGGGAAITTREICEALAERGHEVRVLCTENRTGSAYSLRTDHVGQVRVERVNLPYFKTEDPEGWQLGWRRWREHERRVDVLVQELLASWRPDLVDYHTTRPLGEQCLLTLHEQQRIPVVATLHDAWLICLRTMLLRSPTAEICAGPSPARCLECMYSQYDGSHLPAALKLPWRLLKLRSFRAYRLWRRRLVCRTVAGAIARSRFMAEMHAGRIQGPVEHIPFGIDQSGLTHERPERPRKPLRFGFLGGFQLNKGIDLVLDAAAALKASRLAFQLHVWGPEAEAGRVTEPGVGERVFLHGMYSADQLWQVYREIDVAVVATTVGEPLGRVPLEAAAAGVPTIAPAVGGLTESIRHDVDGLLFRFRDGQDLQRQMRRLLEDTGLLQRLIANLRPVPEPRSAVSAVEDFYRRILQRTAGTFHFQDALARARAHVQSSFLRNQ